ncbi:MAG: HisA/HisF-related TIM barrel protein [Desulfobacteraceae bacterium]|nr:HisA/HisF-related TIM barrel protein [Desulfobacteraceae bacterium]
MTNSGFGHERIRQVRSAVSIPVIASSGAGSAQHFVNIFRATNVEAALTAGIFHRQEVSVSEIIEAMR